MTATKPIKSSSEMAKAGYLRDFLIMLSLANLCYFRVWEALLDSAYGTAILQHSPKPTLILAVMINVLGAAIVGAFATWVVRRFYPGRWEDFGRRLLILAMLLPISGLIWVVRKKYSFVYDVMGKRETVVMSVVVVGLLCLAAWRWCREAAKGAAIILVALSPLIVATFGRTVWILGGHRNATLADRPTAPLNPNAHRSPRVLWFVFDEWDYKFTFLSHPPDLSLPEIDRFARTALSATNAVPPASETIMSVPMLLSGERYSDQRLATADRFEVRPFANPAGYQSLASRDLIFREAQGLGYNTALAGWYLPYCRLFSDQLNACTWLPMNKPENSFQDDTITHAMVDEARSLFESTSFSPFGNPLAATHHIDTYRGLLAASIEAITDPRYGLVFSHLPVPHYPFSYDRKTHMVARKISFQPGDYFNGLALLDRTIGEIRRALEVAGQWDDSVILFSTDHYFRWAKAVDGTYHRRVPFLLKLPRQDHAVVYERRFNTITTKSLLLAILRGEIRTPEEASAWLVRHAIDCDTLGSPSE
jgi:Sulfatase